MLIPEQCLGLIILIVIILIGPWVTNCAFFVHNIVNANIPYEPKGQFVHKTSRTVGSLKFRKVINENHF